MKLSPTQRKILTNALEGRRVFRPEGRSESGGWDVSTISCYRHGYLSPATSAHPLGVLTEEGKKALGVTDAKRLAP